MYKKEYPDFRKSKAIITQTDYHVFKATENRQVEQDPLINPVTGEKKPFPQPNKTNSSANSPFQPSDILEIQQSLQHTTARRIAGVASDSDFTSGDSSGDDVYIPTSMRSSVPSSSSFTSHSSSSSSRSSSSSHSHSLSSSSSSSSSKRRRPSSPHPQRRRHQINDNDSDSDEDVIAINKHNNNINNNKNNCNSNNNNNNNNNNNSRNRNTNNDNIEVIDISNRPSLNYNKRSRQNK